MSFDTRIFRENVFFAISIRNAWFETQRALAWRRVAAVAAAVAVAAADGTAHCGLGTPIIHDAVVRPSRLSPRARQDRISARRHPHTYPLPYTVSGVHISQPIESKHEGAQKFLERTNALSSVDPVYGRNGRAFVSGPKGPGFEPRPRQLSFSLWAINRQC